MAKTRDQIKDLVHLHTGHTDKETLENYQCDNALKVAMMKHTFMDARSTVTHAITEDAVSVDVSGSSILHIVTGRINDTSDSTTAPIKFKNKVWWDKNVIYPSDNQKGWPAYALHWGDLVYFNCPVEANKSLIMRITTEQTFASDATVCPIALLDIFVEKYVTAQVFMSLQATEAYMHWMNEAVGPNYFRTGEVGGELLTAIQADRDPAEEENFERGDNIARQRGIAVENLITGADNYGNTVRWY